MTTESVIEMLRNVRATWSREHERNEENEELVRLFAEYPDRVVQETFRRLKSSCQHRPSVARWSIEMKTVYEQLTPVEVCRRCGVPGSHGDCAACDGTGWIVTEIEDADGKRESWADRCETCQGNRCDRGRAA
jgi:hypothetical protein